MPVLAALVVVAALLLSSCGGGSPEARAASKRALQGEFTGEIRNRVRVLRLELDKADCRVEPGKEHGHRHKIIAAQGEDVQITVVSKDSAHELEFSGFVLEFEKGELLRAQSAPPTPPGELPRLRVALKPNETKVIVLDADNPGEFCVQCTFQAGAPEDARVVLMSLDVKPRLFVLRWVARYGLLALFALLMFGIAGIPMPDEVMLSFAGGLAATGNYNMGYLSTLLTAFLGASCGITFSYVLGRTAGLGVVRKWGKYLHITEERLNRVHEWYEHKKGRWALVFCIYAPVFRHVVAIVAGTSRMRLWEFAALAWSGVLLWVATFITLGYFSAGYWVRMGPTVHYILLVGSLGIGAIILIWYILRNRREHRRHLAQQAAAPQTDKEAARAEE